MPRERERVTMTPKMFYAERDAEYDATRGYVERRAAI